MLTRSVLDDGRGAARARVFKHSHESDTGAPGAACWSRGRCLLAAGGWVELGTSKAWVGAAGHPRLRLFCTESAAPQHLPRLARLARPPLDCHSFAGRTSSIGQHTLCLDSRGNVLNDAMFRWVAATCLARCIIRAQPGGAPASCCSLRVPAPAAPAGLLPGFSAPRAVCLLAAGAPATRAAAPPIAPACRSTQTIADYVARASKVRQRTPPRWPACCPARSRRG